MLRASMEHARDDVAARMLKEQQVEARRVLESLDAALASDGDTLLSPIELAEIKLERDSLESQIETASTEELKQAIKQVEKSSENYVARRMNSSVKQALEGRQIDEVKIK